MKSFPRIWARLCVLTAGLVCGAGCGTLPPIHHSASDQESLRQADLDFAKVSKIKGAQAAFAEYLVPDAVVFPGNAVPLRGRDSILKIMAEGPEEILLWKPVEAEVSAAADFGLTFGTYETRDKASHQVTGSGRYVSGWRKQADGRWKVIFDTGSPNPK